MKGLGDGWEQRPGYNLDPFHKQQGQEVVVMAFCCGDKSGRELGTQITCSYLFRARMLKISQGGLKISYLPTDTCG